MDKYSLNNWKVLMITGPDSMVDFNFCSSYWKDSSGCVKNWLDYQFEGSYFMVQSPTDGQLWVTFFISWYWSQCSLTFSSKTCTMICIWVCLITGTKLSENSWRAGGQGCLGYAVVKVTLRDCGIPIFRGFYLSLTRVISNVFWLWEGGWTVWSSECPSAWNCSAIILLTRWSMITSLNRSQHFLL